MTKSFPLKGPSPCLTDENGVNVCCTLIKSKSVSLHICICQQKNSLDETEEAPSLPSLSLTPRSHTSPVLSYSVFSEVLFFISFYTFFKWPKLANSHIGFCVCFTDTFGNHSSSNKSVFEHWLAIPCPCFCCAQTPKVSFAPQRKEHLLSVSKETGVLCCNTGTYSILSAQVQSVGD